MYQELQKRAGHTFWPMIKAVVKISEPCVADPWDLMSLSTRDCRAEIATGNFRGALKPMPQATKIALLSIINLSALGLTTTWASPARAIIIDPGLI